MNLGVAFGGMSTEHDVSVKSGMSILNNLDKEKYNIFPIYIDKNGDWFLYPNKEKIDNIIEFLKKFDIVFPVLHGLYGEDGSLQGLLEMFKIPYIGCKVLASSICMDKIYTKIILEKAKINQVDYIVLKQNKKKQFIYRDNELDEEILDIDQIKEVVDKKLKYPIFVKPSNSGSSFGVNKVEKESELKDAILDATKYDSKILIERGIKGKEVECAVIGNSNCEVEASRVGEILSAEDFYSFNAKYENKDSKTVIPANITLEQANEIRSLAIKAFKAVDGSGLARIDFFVEENTEKIYLNEINTMPGFTNISMYPQLMQDFGYSYTKLLDKLIELGLSSK